MPWLWHKDRSKRMAGIGAYLFLGLSWLMIVTGIAFSLSGGFALLAMCLAVAALCMAYAL